MDISFPQNETADFSNRDINLLADIQIANFSSLLPTYKYLNLSNNNITAIDSNFIKRFPNIRYLNVSNNKVTKIQGIESIQNLQYLNISNNGVALIESIESFSETLEKIFASRNNIQSIFFNTTMNKLDCIDVRENQINKLSFGLFVPHLRTLKIDSNLLTDINGLSDFNELEVFSAYSNQITEIPKLTKFTLRTMNLSKNKISSLLSLNQTKLVTLDVSDNPIADNGLSEQMTVNKSLTKLFISSTQITRCHCLSIIFPKLSTVDLSNTKLNDLNDLLSFVHEMKELKVLDVRFTPLTHDLYPGGDLLTSARSLLNQNGSPINNQEKHYDSIQLYNQRFPKNSEERIRFRSEVIKSSISQLQTLDHIKVSQNEFLAIESQPIKVTVNNLIEEEEEDINSDYNLEDNTEITEEEELSFDIKSQNKEEIKQIIQLNPQNHNSSINITISQIENDTVSSSTTDQFDSKSGDSDSIEKVIFLGNEKVKNSSDSSDNDYSPNLKIASSSSKHSLHNHQSYSHSHHSSVKSHRSSKNGRNSSVSEVSSFKVFNDFNSKVKLPISQPFFDNPHLYNFLTHLSDSNDTDDDDESSNENDNGVYEISEKENDDNDEEEEDNVMITTQIIAQTLSGGNRKESIDKSIEYINRSVQAEIDSICNEKKKREHDEKMKKIKKLRKENKILEKEIMKYKMRKKGKIVESDQEEAESTKKKKNSYSSQTVHSHHHSTQQEQSKSKSKSSSNMNSRSHSNTETKIQNSSKSQNSHHQHSIQSSSKIKIRKTSKSHRQHQSNKNLNDSDHQTKIPIQSSSSSPQNSDSNSASSITSSTSNSYIIKTKKKSISIEESEIIPKKSNNNDNRNDKVKKSEKSDKIKKEFHDDKFPQIIQLLDGLLAENQKLGGKISATIKHPYNSTPVSPIQVIHSKKNSDDVKQFNSISSSSQKVSPNSKQMNSKSKNSRPEISRKRSKSVMILSDEINQISLPQITREYAEQKIIQSLKSNGHYSPLTEKSTELKFLLLWLIKGLPFSADNIKHDMKDIVMAHNLTINNFNCNLTIKAADKNPQYRKFFESQKQLKNYQLLMLFNFNNDKNKDDCSKSFSELDLDLMFNFDIDQIPNDAEFFKNINCLFKGMPPFLSITVCVVDLGKTKMISNVKEIPAKSQQEKIASKGYNSICYEKSGLKHFILFDKARAVPVYTLLFSTV